MGSRPSAFSASTYVTSSGIPSLDDILGGGLPLSTSFLVLAPDAHSAYGDLVLKYFVAQGLACGQRVCVVSADSQNFLEQCMWLPKSTTDGVHAGADDEDQIGRDDKIKIAWRYEQMKQFQTTVTSSNANAYVRFTLAISYDVYGFPVQTTNSVARSI